MNFNIKVLYLILVLLQANKITCAQIQDDFLIEQILESVNQNLTENYDYSEIVERLNYYKKTPLNINNASRNQLQELFIISAVQISALINHREKNGMFLDVLELQSIPEFDPQTIRWLLNFIVVLPPSLLKSVAFKNLLLKADHDLILRFGRVLEKQSGYYSDNLGEQGIYAGSALRMFTRYRYNYSNVLFASINLEKDAGESFALHNGKRGFDFLSANIMYKSDGFVRKLVLGDYALQFGQGLSMWAGEGFGKGANLGSMAKQDIGLRPYSSVNEALFFRGISAAFALKSIVFTPFYSSRKIDASLSDSNLEISSLQLSGLHRTQSEILSKNAVLQHVYGANLQYNKRDFNSGILAYHTQFSKPFEPAKSLYQRYNFSGIGLSNIAMNFSYNYKSSYYFAEAAHSLNSGYAFLNGLISSIAPRVSLVLLYRNYARNYHSYFNQAIAESSNSVNERGFYSGLVIKFNREWELYTYSDFFRFPWLKFGVDAPSAGHEWFTQISYTPSKLFKINARYRQQVKEENADELQLGLESVNKRNFRFDLIYKITDAIALRNRAEVVSYQKGSLNPEFGFLSFQDVIYDPMGSKISGNIRFALFETSGFNSRIYAFENDVLYAYSVPSFQGKGIRFYINGRYTLSRGIDLWLRYSLLRDENQAFIGNGGDQINGNSRSDIRLQLRFQL